MHRAGIFNREYLQYTREVAETCKDRDLSDQCMVIGTSAIIDTEIDGAVGMNRDGIACKKNH